MNNLLHSTEQLFVPSIYNEQKTYDIVLDATSDIPFTKAEVRDTLFKIDKEKAPGPDQTDFNLLREAFN